MCSSGKHMYSSGKARKCVQVTGYGLPEWCLVITVVT